MKKNLPFIFTLFRLIGAPILVPLFILISFYSAYSFFPYLTFVLYLFSAATDFFDGYFARKYHAETKVGQVLDYTADKIFMLAILLAFVAIGKLSLWWALVLLSREFLVTGFRILAYEYQASIAVSWFGKIKTAVQFCTMGLLILDLLPTGIHLVSVVDFFLVICVVLSWYSAYDYWKKLQGYMHDSRV